MFHQEAQPVSRLYCCNPAASFEGIIEGISTSLDLARTIHPSHENGVKSTIDPWEIKV